MKDWIRLWFKKRWPEVNFRRFYRIFTLQITSRSFHLKKSESFDRCGKLRPFFDHLLKHFQEVLLPESYQSIDEHMCKFKGKSLMRQFDQRIKLTQLEPSDQTRSTCLLWKPISRSKEVSMIGWRVIQFLQQNGWTAGQWLYCLITVIQVLPNKSIEESRVQKRKWRYLVLLSFVSITCTREE